MICRVLAALAVLLLPTVAGAQTRAMCRVVEGHFTPSGDLQITTEDALMFRVNVVTINEEDLVAPGEIVGLSVTEESPRAVSLTFAATGDDGDQGFVASYDVR